MSLFRGRSSVCRAILVTSIAWLMIDVMILFYFLDSSGQGSMAKRSLIRGDRNVALEPDAVADEKLKHVPAAESGRDESLVAKQPIDPQVEKELGVLLSVPAFGPPLHGEGGAGVDVPEQLQKSKDKRFTENQFNVVASEMISVNRSLPDYRSSRCQEKDGTYSSMQLPKVSIIIVFHNEAWTTLLRTLHSVANRSPLSLIEEIILIDDLSDRGYLRKPLDAYLQRLPMTIRIVHLKERSGLIRARLTGSGMAKGKILLFLDAHVEVTDGWLEPLLARVAEDRKRVVAPIIDVISDDTFEYVTASDTTWGGFNWHLNFRWYPVPKRELQRRGGDRSLPIQTPTIAGGLFAIDRQFFYDIGSYDEGMEVWGGENLEISFRTWMCGGSLEIHPCSRVGHVFRKQTPYTFPGGTAKVIHHNAKRTAEVWMDDYKQFFYSMVPAAKHVPSGDLTARQKLRNDLQCKNFKWYLETVYPEAPVPAIFHSLGYVVNAATSKCMDTMGKKDGQPVGLGSCHGAGGNQTIIFPNGKTIQAADTFYWFYKENEQAWSFTGKGEIRSDDLCLTAGQAFAMDNTVRMEKCAVGKTNARHTFIYHAMGHIEHEKTGKCLTATFVDTIELQDCDEKEDKKWTMENYKPMN